MLKKSLLLIMLCLLLSPATPLWAADEPSAGPSAFLPEDVYEFETVVEGTQVTHEFILENRGDESLKIMKIKSG